MHRLAFYALLLATCNVMSKLRMKDAEFDSYAWMLANSRARNLRGRRELEIKRVKILMLWLESSYSVVVQYVNLIHMALREVHEDQHRNIGSLHI